MEKQHIKFFEACSEGHLDVVKRELQFSPRLVQADDYNGVRLACSGGHLSVVKYLCEDAPITSILHTNDWECLKEACQYGHLNVVEYILQNNKTVPSQYIEKSFEECCVRGHLDVLLYFQNLRPEFAQSTEAFYLACQYKSLDIVEHFIGHGIYEQEGVINTIQNKNYVIETKILELIKIREEKKLLDCTIKNSSQGVQPFKL